MSIRNRGISLYSHDLCEAVVKRLKRKYKKKAHFFADMEREIGLRIPKSVTYVSAIQRIVKKGLERDFSQFIWGANSIQEWLDLSSKTQPLDLYAKDEVLKLCIVLQEIDNSWTPEGKTKLAIMFSILRHFNENQISEGIKRAVERQLVSSLVVGYSYVLGPLGILKSDKWFGWEAQFLVGRMLDLVGEENYPKLAMKLPKRMILASLDPRAGDYRDKLEQILIARYSKTHLLQAIQSLIADGKISVSDELRIDDYHTLTPYGIVERGDEPLEDLVDMLMVHCSETTLRSLLKKSEIDAEGIREGLTELCLRETPGFFGALFGIDQLKSVAQSHGFVATDSLTVGDEELLWDLILWKMGFKIPPQLEGRHHIIEKMRAIRTELVSLKMFPASQTKAKRIGLMMEFYSTSERLLKDLVYFYAAVIWNETDNPDRNTLQNALVDGLGLEETLELKLAQNRLTYGEWVRLLRGLVNLLKSQSANSKLLRNNLFGVTGRRKLLDGCSIDAIDKSATMRARYRHDTDRPIPSLSESVGIVEKVISFMDCTISGNVYPILCRVFQSSTNEYGLSYTTIEQESGRKRTVPGTGHLPMDVVFLTVFREGTFSESLPVAIPNW